MKRQYRGRPRKFKAKGSVAVLLLILIAVFAGFRGYALRDNALKTVSTLQDKVITTVHANETLLSQNQTLQQPLLDQQLKFSSTIGTPDYIKASVREYIYQYFPKDQWANAEKISTCEANMNDHAMNDHNTNGSTDYGSFQINSVHADQFQKMFGTPLSVGGFDIDHNVKFAAYLHGRSGWGPWACAPLTGVK